MERSVELDHGLEDLILIIVHDSQRVGVSEAIYIYVLDVTSLMQEMMNVYIVCKWLLYNTVFTKQLKHHTLDFIIDNDYEFDAFLVQFCFLHLFVNDLLIEYYSFI